MIKHNFLKINLQLFSDDDEYVDNDTSELDTPDIDSDNGDDDLSESLVIYGRQEDDDDTSLDTQDKTPSREELYQKFKEEYKDEFTKDFQNVFNQRFKTHKEQEAELQKLKPIAETFAKKYKVDNVDDLYNIINDELIEELADEEGLTVEQYKRWETDKQKAKRADEIEAKIKEQEELQALITDWNEQAKNLSELLEKEYGITDFSLDKEFENSTFYKNVTQKNHSIEDAYFLAHKDELRKMAIKKAENGITKNILAKKNRPIENGVIQKTGVIYKSNPIEFTDDDIDAIRKAVEEGKRISF